MVCYCISGVVNYMSPHFETKDGGDLGNSLAAIITE